MASDYIRHKNTARMNSINFQPNYSSILLSFTQFATKFAAQLDYTYICSVRYAHDPQKRAANLKKHGYDFEDAAQVIESERTVTFEDRRFEYDEQRFITWVMLRGAVVVITTAETDEESRVISMRKAERHEEEIYHGNL